MSVTFFQCSHGLYFERSALYVVTVLGQVRVLAMALSTTKLQATLERQLRR